MPEIHIVIDPQGLACSSLFTMEAHRKPSSCRIRWSFCGQTLLVQSFLISMFLLVSKETLWLACIWRKF